MKTLVCPVCKGRFVGRDYSVTCSNPCKHVWLGQVRSARMSAPIGHRTLSNGYIRVKVGHDFPMANAHGYVSEHRLVAMGILGRPLRRNEPVHHKNHNRTDNRPHNLEICKSHFEHHVKHRGSSSNRVRLPGEPNPLILCECGCGIKRRKYNIQNRRMHFILGHKPKERTHV